ncbi:MAG: diguanylate cyclase [Magnetococcales bacterium]|nr:diguanylate cyclase [Magnetococcales bacterium]
MNTTAPAGRKGLILVADDDIVMRESLVAFFQRNGHEVMVARDGQEVLRIRSLIVPDLIVLDVCMPNLDGFETCRALRRDWTVPRIPIIMLTGLFDTPSVDRAFEAGADDYVTKPIHWAILRQRVRLLLHRSEVEARIRYQANFDGLTDLPNRTLFLDRLTHALLLACRNGESLAVLFIDLDHFKPVNDTLGHGAGDELLRQVAQRLRLCVRQSDTLARLGGDEFTIILANLCQPPDPEIVAEKVLAALSRPFELPGVAYGITISASVGIALYPEHGTDLESLLQKADQAMYQAKGLGRNRYCCFKPPEGTAA